MGTNLKPITTPSSEMQHQAGRLEWQAIEVASVATMTASCHLTSTTPKLFSFSCAKTEIALSPAAASARTKFLLGEGGLLCICW